MLPRTIVSRICLLCFVLWKTAICTYKWCRSVSKLCKRILPKHFILWPGEKVFGMYLNFSFACCKILARVKTIGSGLCTIMTLYPDGGILPCVLLIICQTSYIIVDHTNFWKKDSVIWSSSQVSG